MPDRDDVIAEIVEHIEATLYSTDCACDGVCNFVLSLLKKQEAVKPEWYRGKPFCGACGAQTRGGKFCSECGKPIAWERR